MSARIASEAPRSESVLVFVARIVIFTIIIFASILAIDVLLLWLLNLDISTWLALLFWEGLIIAILGGGAGWRESPEPIFTPLGKPVTTVKRRFRYPWFWVSLGMAGFLLVLLSAYISLQN